ncbi:hypothetical protein O0I10_005951 [Lichtheimia ornata]|uniref:Tyrosine specific protein phosphatases domain-containing protein n=1 Tax=Lichtheimia ornata TaxID=688661 RepID=A0AAD7XZ70_9FUNG|nr:uncharacterized protein O0I10_005951 [Lichtheimia ornata]KAJ8658268.1 hypothetical protein O0I10_005951 [Lichtheimia ornata]
MTTVHIENDRGETIVGLFEHRDIDANREKPRLVLIGHGVQGHKNYLFQRLLGEKLPYSSFRFDFRGNGDSTGTAGYGNIANDVEDYHTVAKYFEDKGYEIWAVVGHSRGSTAGLKYATTCQKPLAHFVNVSGRYQMNDPQIFRNRPHFFEELEKKGYFEWKARRRDQYITLKMTREDVEKFTNWDNSHVARMPRATCMFTCHGLDDDVVPVYNAAMFSNIVPNHTLKLFPGANHNFIGKYEEVVQAILEYFEEHEKNAFEKARRMGQSTGLVMPRWIDVEGVKNFRDIGGWPVSDGKGYIRERFVFRCGHLVNVTPKGAAVLRQLNVVAAFDFRSHPEIQRQGIMADVPGLTRYPSAIFSEADYSPAALASRWQGYFEGATGFPKVYMVILEKGGPQFRKIFLHMLENHSRDSTKSLIIHCTAGKDRTGVFIMLLFGLCGVDEEIIAREYAMSNLGYWEQDSELQAKADMLNVSIDDMRLVMSAPYLAMKETIRRVKEMHGSIEGYVRKHCGLTSDQIEALRDLLIVRIPFEERQLFRPKF